MAMSPSTRTAKATTGKRPAKKSSARSSKATAKSATSKKAAAKKTRATTTVARKSTARKSSNGKAPTKATAKRSRPAKSTAKSSSSATRGNGKRGATKAKSVGRGNGGAASTRSKSAAGVNGKRPKSPFTAEFLEKQKQALREERAVYLHQAEAFEAEADSLIADVEPGDVQFDEESGEGDTLSMERERDLALSAQARAALDLIDHALAKFARGTYGICEISGQPIPKDRLEAIPWAKERVEYKTGSFGSP